MELNFTVNDQLLVLNNDVHDLSMVSDSINNVQCKFIFNNTWDGYLKRIYFKNSSYSILKPVLLDSDNTCIVPWECLSSTGVITCAVVGSKFSNGKLISRLTTNTVVMLVQREESIVKDGFEPTGTEFEQILGTLLDYTDVLISLDTDIKDIQEYIDGIVLDFDSYVQAAEDAAAAAAQSALDAEASVSESVNSASASSDSANLAQASAELARLSALDSSEAADQVINMTVSAHVSDLPTVTKTIGDVVNLDFGLVRGPQGIQGEKGDKGDKGDPGASISVSESQVSFSYTPGPSGSQYNQILKYGRLCKVEAFFQFDTPTTVPAGGSLVVGTIPEGFRPINTTMNVNISDTEVFTRINNLGSVILVNNSNTARSMTDFYINVIYIVN